MEQGGGNSSSGGGHKLEDTSARRGPPAFFFFSQQLSARLQTLPPWQGISLLFFGIHRHNNVWDLPSTNNPGVEWLAILFLVNRKQPDLDHSALRWTLLPTDEAHAPLRLPPTLADRVQCNDPRPVQGCSPTEGDRCPQINRDLCTVVLRSRSLEDSMAFGGSREPPVWDFYSGMKKIARQCQLLHSFFLPGARLNFGFWASLQEFGFPKKAALYPWMIFFLEFGIGFFLSFTGHFKKNGQRFWETLEGPISPTTPLA